MTPTELIAATLSNIDVGTATIVALMWASMNKRYKSLEDRLINCQKIFHVQPEKYQGTELDRLVDAAGDLVADKLKGK